MHSHVEWEGQGPLLNILVNCPKGTRFIKSMDASTYVIDTTLLQVVG